MSCATSSSSWSELISPCLITRLRLANEGAELECDLRLPFPNGGDRRVSGFSRSGVNGGVTIHNKKGRHHGINAIVTTSTFRKAKTGDNTL